MSVGCPCSVCTFQNIWVSPFISEMRLDMRDWPVPRSYAAVCKYLDVMQLWYSSKCRNYAKV